MKAVNYTMQRQMIRFAVCLPGYLPRLRAAEGGNSAADTDISSDDSDGEGGTVPRALAELVPGWMMVTTSSTAGSGRVSSQNPVMSCRGVSSRLAYRRGWRQSCWCMQLCCNVACADVCCQCGCLLLAEWQRIAYSSKSHRLNHILAWTVHTIWP